MFFGEVYNVIADCRLAAGTAGNVAYGMKKAPHRFRGASFQGICAHGLLLSNKYFPILS
jgi:hypothetical protein